MKQTVKVRGTVLGEGMPKICIPLVAVSPEELKEQVQQLKRVPHDLVEWRGDWYLKENAAGTEESVRSAGAALQDAMIWLRKALPDTPILFTIRTEAEGGELSPEPIDYIYYNELALECGADLIDVELSMGEQVLDRLISTAHDRGAYVIGSSHDFTMTPSEAEMCSRLRQMQEAGCDVAKLAVMPRNRADVLGLLRVTECMSGQLTCPVITMSMAADGVISRLCGEVFGSCLTFGTAGKTSAPGQIDAHTLAQVLQAIHTSLK